MVKDALRVTRKLSSKRGRSRAFRAKTFSSEESANTWAKKQGFTKYSLENIKSDASSKKKLRVVVEL